MTDRGLQLYCENMILEALNSDEFMVVGYDLQRILRDTATRSTTYVEWQNEYRDVYRADCVVHDDRRKPPTVMMIDVESGRDLKLEVRP